MSTPTQQRKYIHEKYLEENTDVDVTKFSEALQNKIKKFAETKGKVYSSTKGFQKNQALDGLTELSGVILQDMEAEITEQEQVAEKAAEVENARLAEEERVRLEEEAKSKTPQAAEGLNIEPAKKKKGSSVLGWCLVGITTALAVFGIAQATKK